MSENDNSQQDPEENTIKLADKKKGSNTKEVTRIDDYISNIYNDHDGKPMSDQMEEPKDAEPRPKSSIIPESIEKSESSEPENAEIKPESLGDLEKNKTSETSESKDEKIKSQKKEEVRQKVKLSGHTVPTEPGWHIKMNKTGFTLPKAFRENLHPDQDFFLVQKGYELHFYMINEEDIPNLDLVKKKKQKSGKGKRKGKSAKKPEGPQPEWGKYFLFEFEENNKVQEILDSAFKKFAFIPPNIQEGMDIIKYILVSFIKSSRMNDARLRQTVLFFLCDIVEKFDLPNLVDFIKEKIVNEIKSRYLYQLALNQLAYTSFKTKRYEKAQEFILASMKDIEKYTESETYAIMDSFKNLVVKLTRNVGFLIPQDQLLPIRDSLKEYLVKMEDKDYKIQIVDLLDRMGFTDEAYNIAEEILNSLPEESTSREEIKEIMKDLSSKFI